MNFFNGIAAIGLTVSISLLSVAALAGKSPQQTLVWDTNIGSSDIPDDKQIWDRMRNSFNLELGVQNGEVSKQIDYFLRTYSNGKKEIEYWLEAAYPFIHYVVSELERRRLPLELAVLPIVESKYDPFAISGSQAYGMWQFIPATAKVYDLKDNWWYTGSRDIRAATDAALRYLSDLHEHSNGDWLKALAGYNYGWRRINKLVENNIRKKKPTTFWDLIGLPKETQSYVPRFIALIEIIKNPDRYGVTLPSVPDTPYFSVVHVGYQIDLPKAAELADISVDLLYYLNAGFRRWATPPQGPHELLIPAEAEVDFVEALKSLNFEERFGWSRHKVTGGDNLIRLAARYNTTVDAIRHLNGLTEDQSHLMIGETLIIPSALTEAATPPIDSSRLGQKLYTVQPGDSLWLIAKKHGIAHYSRIRQWNPHLPPNSSLRPGDKLLLWVAGNPVFSKRREPVIRRMFYIVRRGDFVSGIAQRYAVNVQDVFDWNNKDRNSTLHPGDLMILYVDVDHYVN